jgi:ubiquinol-cytochrome c reductase cytochrome b subunit
VKDIVGVVVFLMVFSIIVFFAPEGGGYFLEYNNFLPADPLKTPLHIAPVWYFTPYYSLLRAMVWPLFGIDAKFWGVVAMGPGVVILASCRGSIAVRSSRSAIVARSSRPC